MPDVVGIIIRSDLKHLYISNKTDYFSCKGRCGICVSRYLNEELVWTIYKWFQLVSG